jgi:hypothetical protein
MSTVCGNCIQLESENESLRIQLEEAKESPAILRVELCSKHKELDTVQKEVKALSKKVDVLTTSLIATQASLATTQAELAKNNMRLLAGQSLTKFDEEFRDFICSPNDTDTVATFWKSKRTTPPPRFNDFVNQYRIDDAFMDEYYRVKEDRNIYAHCKGQNYTVRELKTLLKDYVNVDVLFKVYTDDDRPMRRP